MGGQAIVDDLKKLNLELLSEYKDVFTGSYKEMFGLDPKVTVHRISIKRGISSKKQPQ